MEDLTASGVECQKIAVESCSEDQSGSRDRDPCDYRLGRFTAPADNAVVRIDGGDPAFLTLVFLAESICRTEKRLAGFEDRSLRVELYGAAPIDAIDEDEVRFGRKSRTVPQHSSAVPGQK